MEIKNIKERKDGSITFEVSVSGEQWETALNRVPGATADQAAGEFLSGAVDQVCREQEYSLLSEPEFTVGQADTDHLSAYVRMVVYPKVENLDYIGIEVEKPVKTVTEAEIDAAVKQYLEIHPWDREVERGAQMGDLVEVSFHGTCKGEPFPYDHSDGNRFRMGSATLFAGLDEALVGHAAGEDLDLTLTMPEKFHRKALRGKTLDLHVHLKSVQERGNAVCTDEYVRTHVKGAQTVQEFRELQRIRLQRTNDSKSAQAFDRNLERALAALITCPVPECMVEVCEEDFVNDLTKMGMQKGQTLEQTLRARRQTLEQFKMQVRPAALMRVKTSIALDYVVKKENLEVSEDEVTRKIKSEMKKTGLPLGKALKVLGGEENVAEKLKQEKAYSLVREQCKVSEVEVNRIPVDFSAQEVAI